MAHLGAHVSEASWRTENDRVDLGKLIDRGPGTLAKLALAALAPCFSSKLGHLSRGRLLCRGLVWRPRPLLRPCGKHAHTCYKKLPRKSCHGIAAFAPGLEAALQRPDACDAVTT